VDALMKYLIHYLKSETPELNKNNVRLEVIGQIYRLPENVQEHLRKSIATLAKNNGLTLVMALSYGSRIEIVEAVRAIAEKVKSGKLESADINEKIISENLWTRGIPDPDLLIRTSGEMRVSNFLLWQISYAELVITPTLWPDFRKPQFFAALEEYAKRNRRFGGV
jgi:undecaprenyl diphosphate synthase